MSPQLNLKYSKRDTKIFLFNDITYFVESDYKWKMGRSFVAFSEYLNFEIKTRITYFYSFIGKQAAAVSATPSSKSTVSQPPQPPQTPPQPSITATPATPTTPTIATKAGQEQIAAYLESNPEFLENYVISNVDFQTVERWVIRKARDVQKGTGGKIYYENMPN